MSTDADDAFEWLSDSWNTIKHPNPELMHKAHQCIVAAVDHKDAIAKLKEAGFRVTRGK